MVKLEDKIAVWFSCGAASAMAAKLTLEKYPNNKIHIVYNPVDEEDPDNLRFLRDIEKWLDHEIEIFANPKLSHSSAEEVWKKERYMAGVKGAPCTTQLKKQARQEWEKIHKPDWHVLGFTREEKERHDKFILFERPNLLPILIEQNVSKQRCFNEIQNAGINLPDIYHLGYPNANCVGCVKVGSPTYWNHVRKTHPEVFQKRLELSRELGVKLTKIKGKRIFLDELPEDAKGHQLSQRTIAPRIKKTDCGIFCEE